MYRPRRQCADKEKSTPGRFSCVWGIKSIIIDIRQLSPGGGRKRPKCSWQSMQAGRLEAELEIMDIRDARARNFTVI
jgi:hypothetical protein